jgi:hypothetical protein
MNERQVPAQVEFGEAGQYATENQEGKEGDQGHGEKLIGKDVPEFFHFLKITEDTVEDNERAYPEGKAHRAKEKGPQSSALQAFRNPPVFE